jgi:hypothetical protein
VCREERVENEMALWGSQCIDILGQQLNFGKERDYN